MTPIIKLILTSPKSAIQSIHFRRIARKHRKYPDAISQEKRVDAVAKLVSRILKLYNIDVVVKGLDNLPKAPALILPNHVNNLDAFVLIKALSKSKYDFESENKPITFLSKIELKKKKTVKSVIELIDGIFIDRDKPLESWKGLKEFVVRTKEDKKYGVIFPEGTRSKDGKVGEFKGGAFRVARMNYLPIVPTVINYSNVGFDKSNKKATVEVEFLKAIKPQQLMSIDEDKILTLVRNQIVDKFISGEKHE